MLYTFLILVHTISNPRRDAAKARRFSWGIQKKRIRILILPLIVTPQQFCCGAIFYYIGNCVPYVIKKPLGDNTAAERRMLSATARRRRRLRFRAIFLINPSE